MAQDVTWNTNIIEEPILTEYNEITTLLKKPVKDKRRIKVFINYRKKSIYISQLFYALKFENKHTSLFISTSRSLSLFISLIILLLPIFSILVSTSRPAILPSDLTAEASTCSQEKRAFFNN